MRSDRLPWLLIFDDDGTPRPAEAWRRDVDALAARSVRDVFVGGGEPAQHPDLPQILAALAAARRRPLLLTDGRALAHPDRLRMLIERGLHEVCVWATSDAVEPMARAAAAAGVRLSLAAELMAQVEPPLDTASTHGLPLRLLRGTDGATVDPPRLDAARRHTLDRLWQRAADAGVLLLPDGLGASPDPQAPGGASPIADASLYELLGRAVVPASATGGVRALPGDPRWLDHGHLLRASGTPAVDLPPCMGGVGPSDLTRRAPGCTPCPAACEGLPTALPDARAHPPAAWSRTVHRVAVVLGIVHDELLPVSTFPGLARALRALDVDVAYHSAWDVVPTLETLAPPRPSTWWQRAAWWTWRAITRRPTPLDSYTPPPDKLHHPHWGDGDAARASRVERRFLAGLDLSERELVVVAGYQAAGMLLDNPTLRPDARIVVADLHMLAGAAELANARNPPGVALMDGAWWPDREVAVHACFPRYARLYVAQGIPLDRVWWRPYPLDRVHFRADQPPSACDHIFVGGRHHRDHATLEVAAAQLDGVHPIHVYVEPTDAPAAVGPLTLQGSAPLPDFVAALRTSRFVVLPLLHDVNTAAGLTVLSMAQAAGRPVIASTTLATLATIRHGEDGLLVPPGDPDALADAIRRLDTDPALLERLTQGAERAGERLDVSAWARELVGFEPAHTPAHRDAAGVWHAWAPLEEDP